MSNLGQFDDWLGHRETAEDQVTLGHAYGMAALLDLEKPAPDIGDPLPMAWHWMFFMPKARQSQISPDGHPERGGFLPPVQLPRRMFAGAKTILHDPLRVGDSITREGKIIGISEKNGQSGPLVFVKVSFRITTPRGLAIEEENTIVYRDEPKTTPRPPPKADLGGTSWQETVNPDPVFLFRYSALTFNGHRIHYDHPYVTKVEGYPGLVVHGPLIATLLCELARRKTDNRLVAQFSFRAISPLFDTAPFTIAGYMNATESSCRLVAVNSDGGTAMEAEMVFAE
jgi:3-methylfumaryl-CoA hydratase